MSGRRETRSGKEHRTWQRVLSGPWPTPHPIRRRVHPAGTQDPTGIVSAPQRPMGEEGTQSRFEVFRKVDSPREIYSWDEFLLGGGRMVPRWPNLRGSNPSTDGRSLARRSREARKNSGSCNFVVNSTSPSGRLRNIAWNILPLRADLLMRWFERGL